MEYVTLIASLVKLFLIFYEKFKNTTPEERRAALSELDAAVEKSKDAKDLRDLSKWLGRKL
jgi:hypothetical protein